MAVLENGQKRSERGRFTKGCEPGPGRPPGRPNDSTVDARRLRAEMLASWDRVGGDRLLDDLAKSHPLAYLRLVASLVPKPLPEVAEPVERRVVLTFEAAEPPPDWKPNQLG